MDETSVMEDDGAVHAGFFFLDKKNDTR